MSSKYERPFPAVIRIEPAAACNLACSHCPTGTIKLKRGIMSPETFALALKNLEVHKDRIRVVVLYHGGEPLLNKQFSEMVRSVKALGIPLVKTVSNGMLLSSELMTEIVESGLDVIEFSLDGENADENNFVRRNCEFDQVVTNVKELIRIRNSLNSASPKVFISTTQFMSEPATSSKSKHAEPPRYLVEAFKDQYPADIAGFKPTIAMRWPHMEVDEAVYDLYVDPDQTEDANRCSLTDETITVRWNGDVVPCCFDLTSQCITGNIHQASLEEIWNNQNYLHLRESIDTRNFNSLCGNCNMVKPSVYLLLKKSSIPLPLSTATISAGQSV